MKTAIILVSAAALLAACNQGRPAGLRTAQGAPGLVAGSEQFDLRMLGVDPGDATAVLLGIRELRVEAPAAAVLEIDDSSLDLADTSHAWLLGRVTVPAGTTEVRVVIVFDDFGGLESPTGASSIRARGAEVAFTAPIDYLRLNGHAVVHLDVASSLTAQRAGELLLLPALSVHY